MFSKKEKKKEKRVFGVVYVEREREPKLQRRRPVLRSESPKAEIIEHRLILPHCHF